MPLVGVVAFHWTVFSVILLYWFENVVIGAFNVLKMAFANPRSLASDALKLFLIPFFIVHYGIFAFVHGMIILALFGHATSFSPGPAAFVAAVRGAGVGWRRRGHRGEPRLLVLPQLLDERRVPERLAAGRSWRSPTRAWWCSTSRS